jgi:transposase
MLAPRRPRTHDKKRKKLDTESAAAIYRAFIRYGMCAAKMTGHSLGFETSTIYKAVQQRGAVVPRFIAPHRPSKWSEAEIARAVAHIEDNPTETLHEIIKWAIGEGLPQISVSTLHGYLEAEVITYKQITNRNQQRNSPENRQARAEWAGWFLQHQDLTFVYVDEFGFNLALQRHYGRSRSGTPAIQVTPANEGANVSVAAAVQRSARIICYQAQDEPFTTETFNGFIDQIIAHFQANPEPGVCLVMDNCRIHDRQDLPRRLEEAGFLMKFLPPYSPMLNPIEEVIGDIKREIRTLLSGELHEQVLAIQSLHWGQKTHARREILRTSLDRTIREVTVQMVDQHFAHSYSFLTPVINNEYV